LRGKFVGLKVSSPAHCLSIKYSDLSRKEMLLWNLKSYWELSSFPLRIHSEGTFIVVCLTESDLELENSFLPQLMNFLSQQIHWDLDWTSDVYASQNRVSLKADIATYIEHDKYQVFTHHQKTMNLRMKWRSEKIRNTWIMNLCHYQSWTEVLISLNLMKRRKMEKKY
jgi:hypothetical protein